MNRHLETITGFVISMTKFYGNVLVDSSRYETQLQFKNNAAAGLKELQP